MRGRGPALPRRRNSLARSSPFAVSCVKPDPRIYLMAIDQLGVFPADTLYVGDGGDGELTGAACAGLRAAQAAWYVARALPGTIPIVATPRDVIDQVFP